MQSVLDEYQDLLTKRIEAQKTVLELDAKIQLLELKIQLQAGSSISVDSETERFIAEHAGRLQPDVCEFLEQEYRGPKEVNEITGISHSTLRRLADSGKLEVKRADGGHRRYKAVSVIRYKLKSESRE